MIHLACRKVDVTREHISRILELREILLSFQTSFNLVNAAVASAILESVLGLESSSIITEPRYLKLMTVSSFCPFTLISVEAAVQSLKKGKSAGQHRSRTGPSRWRGCNHRSHDSLYVTRSGRQENGQPCGPCPQSSHFPRKATCSRARTPEISAT